MRIIQHRQDDLRSDSMERRVKLPGENMQSENPTSWTLTCNDSVHEPRKTCAAQGDVVDDLVDTSTWRYAVINVRSEPDRERLVIAYPDEETLRDLIADPSIVTLDYRSRADALNNIDHRVTSNASLKRLLKMTVLRPDMTFLNESCVALRRLAGRFELSRSSNIMRILFHNTLAGALVLFYSRNVLSATVRALISF